MQDDGSGGRQGSGGKVASGGRAANGGVAANGGREGSGGKVGDGGREANGGQTAATSSKGGKGTGGSGANGTGGAAGTTGAPNSSSTCPAVTNATMAVHTVIDVTWPATLGSSGGSGKFHIWSIDTVSVDGDTLTGKTKPCGSTVPEITLTSIVGGGKVLIEVPPSVWEMQPPLEFSLSGTTSGWSSGGTISQTGEPALVGLTMADATAAWPASYTAVTPADVDKDGKPGLTAIPKTSSGFVNPPVSVVGALGPRADQVDLASRTAIDLSGSFTSCTEHSGKATAKFLDNHVVACHLAGGSDCSAAQAKFLDDNRTTYVIGGGTYVAKMVSDSTSCADVRAALP